jgi:branched-chain amino acid transport system permease protein
VFGASAFVFLVAVVSGHLSAIDQGRAARGMVFGVILLSLVLLTGYGGQVSLAQMTFVGLGAYAMGHAGHGGNLLGVVAGVALAAAFGAAVALPTLRLRGLYLALATLAFAQAMDYLFFNQTFGSYGQGLRVARVHIPGVPGSDRAYFVLLAVVFGAATVALLAVRRGGFGRRLAALNDSPQACATLGANVAFTKLALCAASAGLAGLAGALYGGQQHVVTPDDFVLLNSLVILLLLLIGGRNTVTGVLIGAMFFAVGFPIAQEHFPSLSKIQFLLTGIAAITVGQNPNGIGGKLAGLGERVRARFGRERIEDRPLGLSVEEERFASATT